MFYSLYSYESAVLAYNLVEINQSKAEVLGLTRLCEDRGLIY